MITGETIRDFDSSTKEGKLLLMAIAILTSVEKSDIPHKFGGMASPDNVYKIIIDLTNKVFYEKEYDEYLCKKKREDKIDTIINENPTH